MIHISVTYMTVSRQSNFIAAFCMVKHREMVATTIVSEESATSNLMDRDPTREATGASESLVPTYLPTYLPHWMLSHCDDNILPLQKYNRTREQFKIINAWNEANVIKLSGKKL
jgi:hypothetical protein